MVRDGSMKQWLWWSGGPDDAEQCARGRAGDWRIVGCRLSNGSDAKGDAWLSLLLLLLLLLLESSVSSAEVVEEA